MGIINVWHTMMMMAEPHGVRSNLPRSYIHSTAGIFYFIARPSFGLKDCVCAIIPTQRNFSVCFLSLPPDDHCLFLCFASMGGYLISEICCCRKLWSGLFWKAQEDFYYRQSQKISPSRNHDTHFGLTSWLHTPPPPPLRCLLPKPRRALLMMIFLHIRRKIRRRRNFHWSWGQGAKNERSTGQFEVWCSKCDH